MNEQTSPSFPANPIPSAPTESWDGTGAGDHDQRFAGFRAYQFSTRELARLLLLRGDVLEARLGHGRLVDDLAPCSSRLLSGPAAARLAARAAPTETVAAAVGGRGGTTAATLG